MTKDLSKLSSGIAAKAKAETATTAFSDGDIVEADANNGIVRKIK